MLITVRVIPRSSKNVLEWEQGERGRGESMLKARLTAAPVDGAANEALIALLAERLGIPKRTISILRGASSRQKTVEIIGMTEDALKQKV